MKILKNTTKTNLITDEDKQVWENYVKSVKKIETNNVPLVENKKIFIKTSFGNFKDYYFKTYLDLHGYTIEKAYLELYAYLLEAKKQGLKHVSVITGKGKVDNEETLNKLVPRWLNEKPLKNFISSYEFLKHNQGELLIKINQKGS
ncbi:MAG: hypothetical protein BWY78_00720 [Alphaproteobacteria bacterium ADurb.Bin438]|nr:MAG: hypothetical protein BWY78_00720 [Alphaproteobacteria bacterium ADurb.Bin438]